MPAAGREAVLPPGRLVRHTGVSPASRRLRHRLADRARLATQAWRALPDFVVIGTQKSGTTSLFKLLAAHPDVAPPIVKEIHYFDRRHHLGDAWYRAHFPFRPAAAARADGGPASGRLTGEASPSYLFFAPAMERLAATLPRAQLLVMLRNPVDRAYSHYRMKVRRGIETLSFEEALDAEPERLAGVDPERLRGPHGRLVDEHRHYSYVARGRYADQLRHALRHVDRERLHVFLAEDLFADSGAFIARVLGVLGLPPASGLPVDRPSNTGGRHDPMGAVTRARLEQVFREPNAELAELLGRELPW